MPIKKSAKKYMRITVSKTAKNIKIKGLFRSAIKKTRESVAKGSTEDAKTWLKKTIQALDKAAQKNVISKNTAARKKSRLNKFVKSAFVKK
ncbi:MAG: 30S ribosomal protein S20 [Candidatus Moranbacteria bacterium RBG_19FT_COMBO_42_6]|nr:MAG: 30S ribosomal protein S20 [Candidatus Moranbacteria bacterium RBG_19FT_COMBO_42_6]